MGFLDHSTNNIIVDAVLTDTGRQTLSKNDGSFVVSKFAFGDDEVDYSLIKKFGATVGKEKISKNTPVFEAQTNGDLALKYRLLSISTPDLLILPTLANGSGSPSLSTFTRGDTTLVSTNWTVDQTAPAGMSSIPTDLVDSAFVVQYDDRFVTVVKSASGGTSTKSVANNVATITVSATGTVLGTNGGMVILTVSVNSFADDYYNTYATYPGSNNIKTLVTVSGRSSGAMIIQEFNIKKNSA
jgi:hypothetical protein